MSLSLEVNRGVLCRGCRKTSEETSQMIFLFNYFHAEDKKSVEFRTIYDLFFKYTQLEIDESDRNTSYICIECYQKLSDFHDFLRICIASHLEFQRQKYQIASDFEPQRTNVRPLPLKNNQINILESDVVVKQEADNDNENQTYWENTSHLDDNKILDASVNNYVQTDLMSKCSDDGSDVNVDNEPTFSAECNDESSSSRKNNVNIPNISIEDPNDLTLLKELLCEACGKAFTDSKSYEKHMQTHNAGLKLFPCDKCEKEYTTRGNLKLHMETKHPVDDVRSNKLTCHICFKVLCYEVNLKQHLLRHEGKREHVCSICGQKSTTKAELKRHVNRHTKERAYPCNLCSKVFYGCFELSRHKKVVHQGIKNYKCSLCDKTFGLKLTLASHMRNHTGQRANFDKEIYSITKIIFFYFYRREKL